ncbi:putative transcriptional regulator, contains C-terminal CBS domains [Methanolobus tindarius DSM 2278]|uniref:Putative transcriptional regulator, contains C-terminal CBS domains n=1 Tax=Methanolobus tindarius DSM 2278 TaxID=1090322 RepID=W9DPF5_METTI|nr:CBS domain-containing protein [Methanolobus tindarius]ETA68174.1 putative transcriptional regulator, contains C-terminal CBS domains [Methanolobus tindarius DSM 2278]
MELTPIQKDILIALINLQREKDRAVKGEEIAELISRNPGTVRNQMQSLKVLGLVEGVPGPKGGYKATGEAYEALSITAMDHEASVPIFRNDQLVDGATVAEISFTTVRHPDLCHGMIKVLGNIKGFEQGDLVQAGPTPVNKLVVRGEIVGRDDTQNTLVFCINEMISLPKKPVKNYARTNMISISENASIQETARILVDNGIHGAPVMNGEIILGVVTFTDIGDAVASGKMTAKVKDIMTRDLITVDAETSLYDAVKMFDNHNIGFLLVSYDGMPKGVLSKKDVFHELVY